MDNNCYDKTINSSEDLLDLLDTLFREPAPFWNQFYTDRNRGLPFFIEFPDENLVSYFHNGFLKEGKVLELECGNG